VFGALAILALALFIYRKRRNAHANAPTADGKPVYELVGNKGIYATTELPIESQVSELPPDGTKPGVQRVHEMPG
jgi:hypothetical protein